MALPDDQDRITCPQSGESLKPEKVWETKNPDGNPQRFGTFKKHHHNRRECPWSHLSVPATRENKKD